MSALAHQNQADTGDKKPQRQFKQKDGDEVKNTTDWAGSIVVEPVNWVMEWESSVSMVKGDQRSSEANLQKDKG